MDDFDLMIEEMLEEYINVEGSIKKYRSIKKLNEEELSVASRYLFELKGQIIELMKEYGVKSSESGKFLVSRKKTQPKVVIEQEAEIPEQYCRIVKEPDKKALSEAIRSGVQIDGVRLNNGSETIQIRSK